MKNIAIIIQKLNGGGAERTAANLSNMLSNYYNVHLIVFDGSNIKYPYTGTLHDLHAGANKNIFIKIINVIKRRRAVKFIKRNEEIVASISLLDESNLINALTLSGDKIITSVRNNMSQEYNKFPKKTLKRMLIRFISKRSNYLVALSEDVAEDLIQNFGSDKDKTITIYNPCNVIELRRASERLSHKFNIKPLSVSTMGRLTEQKGQWHLIRAFSEVVNVVPEATLYILGTGDYEKRLKELAKEYKIENNVCFLGYVEAPHAIIEGTRVFVFPSLYEGLGNVLLEAMAFGIPCISSDCYSGPREIIAPGTKIKHELSVVEYSEYGILVSADSNANFNSVDPLTKAEKQLAEAIISILTNKDLRDQYASKGLLRSKDFLPEKICREWMSLID